MIRRLTHRCTAASLGLALGLLAGCSAEPENTAATPGGQTVAAPEQPMIDPANVAALRGEKAFIQCAACHSVVEGGPNKIGPTLAGVFGRAAGTVDGYNYSPALASSGIVWDAAALDAITQNPNALIPGSKMVFAGISDAERRADIVAYLKAISE